MNIKNKISPLVELLRGLVSYLPGFDAPVFTRTGGTNSARYCYSVWLRHLVMAKESGVFSEMPKVIAELGPGDSLGMGLAALLSGGEKYYAFDVVKYADIEKNLEILDELIELFRLKKSIPNDKEFPLVKPYLENYSFPDEILNEELLKNSLKEERLDLIRESIKNPEKEKGMIVYQVPWNDSSIIKKNSVDMIFSQATLEHVDDIENTYQIMYEWLKLGGFISHQIDLKCHGTSEEWNGHWTYSDPAWKVIRGKRQWLLNRLPCSEHIKLLEKNNFNSICIKKIKTPSKIARKSLADKFKSVSEEDLKISGVFFIAEKYGGKNNRNGR
ncbi:MAG: methyltransferase domain-containing protein [Parcubacteria group bacterium]|jgi:hypothetical protein